MDEENGGGGAARNSPTFVSVGSRQRFTVELRPGETTIVSWKKLVKDASKAGGSTSAAKPPPVAIPELDSRLAPVKPIQGQPAENEMVDGPPSRFSAVIEKIERLYMGKHSSDEEDLNDIPDDDEYDTEDSFIDDTELDEYFQVDNSAIKHDGFFVNRGILERINEPNSLPNQQPKKRRRKDLEKGHGEGNDDHLPNKLVKVGKKAAGKSEQLLEGNMGLPHVVALPSVHNEDMKFQNQTSTSVICAKKNSSKTKTLLDPPLSSRVSNSDATLSLEDIDRQKPEMPPSKYQGSKSKDGIETSDALVQKSHEKSSHAQCKFEPGILSNNICELDQSVQWKEKDGNCERPDLNVSAGKITMQTAKAPVVQRKDGSSVRLKNTMLEKAIGELEKMVAESRPPTMEVQDTDIASQVVKRRLPREVKQKLAKVARLAQASHGRISKELVNRLMSIVGHLVQLRTLKRNLKDMVNMGLTAKKEKDDRVQQMKKEVAELIRVRVPYIKSKVLEQQAGGSDDFQEMGIEEKEVIKRKYSMNDALEDKICDLYDLYVDGLDEDAGPQVRKLYAELAHLWPEGFMDNHGIKRAICRAKDRKRALYSRNKDQEKIKRKKLIPKTEETVRVDTSVAQSQLIQEKLVSESNNHGLTSVSKLVPSTTTINATVRIPSSLAVAPNLDWPKQEKVKGSSVILSEKITTDALAKKKVKRKPESELVEAHFRLEKSASTQGGERIKSHKQVAGPPAKTSLPVPSTAAASAATSASSLPLNLNSPADMR